MIGTKGSVALAGQSGEATKVRDVPSRSHFPAFMVDQLDSSIRPKRSVRANSKIVS
jgi:hypothetical protein